jgi:hypothetical protein
MQTVKSMQLNQGPPSSLTASVLPCLPLLKISLLEQREPTSSNRRVDALLQVEYSNQQFTFAADYKANWQERTLNQAIKEAQQVTENGTTSAGSGEVYPLVVLPYLSEKHLDTLAENCISGLDLCGNALILISGKWLIRQSGKPNRFRIEQSLSNPYQGKSSLVGRTLLQVNSFRKIEDLYNEILRREGDISLALVSRVLQRLEEDVITTRSKEYKVRLVQADKLINALTNAYDSRKVKLVWRGKMPETPNALQSLFTLAKTQGSRIAMTGLGSVTRHASVAMESTTRLYIESETGIENLLGKWGATATNQFANLEVYTYPDATCFFDTATDASGIVWASNIQTHIEMMNSNDIRLKESAAPIWRYLLEPDDSEEDTYGE